MAFAPMGAFEQAAIVSSPSPVPSLSQQARMPSGRTPNAKRPITPDTVGVANTGDRVLNLADMTAGFNNLSKLQARDTALLGSTSSAVEWNSQLLNALITRVNMLKASNTVAGQKVDNLTTEITRVTDILAATDMQRDQNLRDELSAMTVKLDEGHAQLKHQIASMRPVDVGQAAPGLDMGSINGSLAALRVDVDSVVGRLHEVVGKVTQMDAAQSNVSYLSNRVELIEQTVTEQQVEIAKINTRGDAQGAAPAPPAQTDSWQQFRDATGMRDHRTGQAEASAPTEQCAPRTFP